MLFYFTDDQGQTIAFQRIQKTATVPAVVRIMAFRKGTDMTADEPDVSIEINAADFQKMADLVT